MQFLFTEPDKNVKKQLMKIWKYWDMKLYTREFYTTY